MKKLREEIDERELKKAAFLNGKKMKVSSASYMKGANFASRPSPLRKSVVWCKLRIKSKDNDPLT